MKLSIKDLLFALMVSAVLLVSVRDCVQGAVHLEDSPTGSTSRRRLGLPRGADTP